MLEVSITSTTYYVNVPLTCLPKYLEVHIYIGTYPYYSGSYLDQVIPPGHLDIHELYVPTKYNLGSTRVLEYLLPSSPGAVTGGISHFVLVLFLLFLIYIHFTFQSSASPFFFCPLPHLTLSQGHPYYCAYLLLCTLYSLRLTPYYL